MPPKTAAAIVARGTDYVLQVQGNQPNLRARSAAGHRAAPAPAPVYAAERRSGARCPWQTSVYTGPDAAWRAAWTGLARVVGGVNTVQRAPQRSRQTRYYLTRPRPVAELAAGSENKWHRTRAVHFTRCPLQTRPEWPSPSTGSRQQGSFYYRSPEGLAPTCQPRRELCATLRCPEV